MRKWLIMISVFVGILILTFIYITVPRHVDKSFTGYVFSKEHKFIKEVSISLEGNWKNKYTRFGKEINFIGTIKIDDDSVDVEGSGFDSDIDNSKYFSVSNKINASEKGVIELSTYVAVSKDFKTVFGFTSGLIDKYGEGSYFKSDKVLETFLDKR